jgi:linoleate 8R-lipoxygenase/9,12-octadecadienoate 8-hydroperoxide 8R-isomerase
MMRTFKDGKIKPDSFSEKRLLGFPPGVGAMLVMFNRYHNYIVDKLAM